MRRWDQSKFIPIVCELTTMESPFSHVFEVQNLDRLFNSGKRRTRTGGETH